MVTSFERHWNNILGNRTYYTRPMFRNGMSENKIKGGTGALFIKLKKGGSGAIEGCWIGKVFDFEKINRGGKDRFYFVVKIEKEIQCPAKYLDYTEGWYPDEGFNESEEVEKILDPKFFYELKTTLNWQQFEKYTYYLLRCLGIHTTHRFGLRKQRGKADGFFKFSNLAVLYDCTLEDDFEANKSTQIDNFCDQLQKGKIEYNSKSVGIKACTKNVWIITRTSQTRIIKEIDEVVVKEVPINKLIDLYRRRLESDIDDKGLEIELQNI